MLQSCKKNAKCTFKELFTIFWCKLRAGNKKGKPAYCTPPASALWRSGDTRKNNLKPQATRKSPKHPVWIATTTCDCLLLRPWSWVWASTAFPHHTNHPSPNRYPGQGDPLFWLLLTLCVSFPPFHLVFMFPSFLPEDELPSVFGSPLFSVLCYQGVTSGQGRALLPRYLWKGFPPSSFGRDPKIPRTWSSFQVIHPIVSSCVLLPVPKYLAFTF